MEINIKRGHLNTVAQAKDRTRNGLLTRTMLVRCMI